MDRCHLQPAKLVLNLISIGLASFNAKKEVPSDLSVDKLFIPPQNISTQTNLDQISKWTIQNEMKINSDKSKYMIINFCQSFQFQTRLYIENSMLEQVKQVQLLGVIISDDLTWHANTSMITKKANKRMIILIKLSEFKVKIEDLLQIYKLFIRSVVETSCVVWSSSITKEEQILIERVQKTALKIIYKEKYTTYERALETSNLLSLSERRTTLTLRFAQKCIKSEKTKEMFPVNVMRSTRKTEKYNVIHAYTERLKNSAVPQMARQLNEVEITKKR